MEEVIADAPFGPIDERMVIDDFSLEEVTAECVGSLCPNLKASINAEMKVKTAPGTNYMVKNKNNNN